MRTLDYLARVLDTLDAYLDALKPEKARADKIAAMAAADPDLELEVPDFTAKAWEALKGAGSLPASRVAIPCFPMQGRCGPCGAQHHARGAHGRRQDLAGGERGHRDRTDL